MGHHQLAPPLAQLWSVVRQSCSSRHFSALTRTVISSRVYSQRRVTSLSIAALCTEPVPFRFDVSYHRRLSYTRRYLPSSRRRYTMVAEDFESVLKGKYPAKAHAKRTVQVLRDSGVDANGVIYIEGRMTKLLEDNDSPEHFRQRRFFYYLTGCNLADCHFVYDIQSSKSILFIPPIDPEDVVWSGLPTTIDDALAKYDVDEVRLTTEVNSTLAHLGAQSPHSTIFAIDGQISDDVSFIGFDKKDFKAVKVAMEKARVVKDEFEVAMIRKANYISGLAHKAVVQKAKTAKTENELEAVFLERCVAHGAKEMAYHPIVASGTAAATLHYVDNTQPLDGKLNLLIDAGAEWNNYAADITRTFPLNGKFSKETQEIYDIVLKMQTDTIALIKPGVLWDDLHLLAHKIALEGLLALGVLKGDKDEIFAARTTVAFFPHGLGHYLGMDTHDTGGNPNRQDKDKYFPNLRLRGHVPVGGVVTVEPGIYFCEFIIKPYLTDPAHSKFIDTGVLDKYWKVGGIRIEDNILVTENGHENLTDAIKERSEIEALFA